MSICFFLVTHLCLELVIPRFLTLFMLSLNKVLPVKCTLMQWLHHYDVMSLFTCDVMFDKVGLVEFVQCGRELSQPLVDLIVFPVVHCS